LTIDVTQSFTASCLSESNEIVTLILLIHHRRYQNHYDMVCSWLMNWVETSMRRCCHLTQWTKRKLLSSMKCNNM